MSDTLTPEEAWQDLLDKDDRTSPSDTPEMALITFEELRDYMQSVAIAEREGLEREVERAEKAFAQRSRDFDREVQNRIAAESKLSALKTAVDGFCLGVANSSFIDRAIKRMAAELRQRIAALSVAPPSQGMETLVEALKQISREGENGMDMWGCRFAARDALAAFQSHPLAEPSDPR